MKYLGFLLHIYQPPTNLEEIVRKITESAYLPLIRVINSQPEAKFNLNINYSLTEQLVEYGYDELIAAISEAAENQRIEFTESGAYHPILPLIPEDEMIRQLHLNHESNYAVFGSCYQPKGIFPPECAISEGMIQTLAKHYDFQWILTDDQPYSCTHQGTVPYNFIPQVANKAVLMRSNMWSNRIAWDTWGKDNFVKTIKSSLEGWFGQEDGYLILAMDGETFGWHHKHYEENFLRQFLIDISKEDDITLCTLSEITQHFPLKDDFIPAGSWSTSIEDVYHHNPYPLWQSRFNHIHKSLWALTHHLLNCVKRVKIDEPQLRDSIDRSLYSCPYWWAQKGTFFDPCQVYRGADLIMETLKLYCIIAEDQAAYEEGQELYREIIYQVKARQKREAH